MASTDIFDISDKVIVITGGSGALGPYPVGTGGTGGAEGASKRRLEADRLRQPAPAR